MNYGITPTNLSTGIAVALLYRDQRDEEVEELAAFLEKHSLAELLGKHTKLSAKENLHQLIISTLEEHQAENFKKT